MAKKKQTHYSGIGGQAVLEGVMMKNRDKYAVAVRKPNGEIDVEVEEYKGVCGGKEFINIFYGADIQEPDADCSISFGLALAGWLRTKRRRVIQWLTVAILPRPPTSSINRSISVWFILLIIKPHGR